MRTPARISLATRWRRIIALACLGTGAIVVACSSGSAPPPSDAGPLVDATQVVDGEPEICTEFTEAGAPCSRVSPVRCFPECTTGGCSCTTSPSGARWTCTTDLSCVPDCAPLDDACSQPQGGDDGGATGDGGGVDGGDAGATGDGGADAGAAGDGGGDASGASDAAPG
jgi:hypothetical protein